ncbi:MAG: DUF6572 domain-containing protein [Christensenellaceae bacterium]|jgi:hypothetical protein
MSLKETNVIDGVLLDEAAGNVILVMEDELGWVGGLEYTHLLQLQEKTNVYVAYVEEGTLYEEYEAAKGKPVLIEIRFLNAPTENGLKFIEVVNGILENTEITLTYTVTEA